MIESIHFWVHWQALTICLMNIAMKIGLGTFAYFGCFLPKSLFLKNHIFATYRLKFYIKLFLKLQHPYTLVIKMPFHCRIKCHITLQFLGHNKYRFRKSNMYIFQMRSGFSLISSQLAPRAIKQILSRGKSMLIHPGCPPIHLRFLPYLLHRFSILILGQNQNILS